MIKKIIFILIISLILAQTIDAIPTRIQILNLKYQDNTLSLTEKVIKLGYYPDRLIQPKTGHTYEIVATDETILHTFKFIIPTRIFVDVTDPIKDKLSGGIVKLNKTEFALIVPYFKKAKEIRIYDEQTNIVLTIDVKEEQMAAKKGIVWSLGIGLMVLLIIIFSIIKRKKVEKVL